jgi:hypothetical protein
MSNDDENKHPSSVKKSTTRQTQYRILPRNQPDESTTIIKKPDLHSHDLNTPTKSQRNKREFLSVFFVIKKRNNFFYQVAPTVVQIMK